MMKEKKWGYFWMGYFLFTILVIGFVEAYLLVVPLCLLGRIFRPARKLGEKIFTQGVFTLLTVQPWLTSGWRFLIESEIEKQKEQLASSFISVSNHRSTLDMFILLAQIRGVRATTKQAFLWVPFFNIMVWILRMIPIKRRKISSYTKKIEYAVTEAKAGEWVHIFPEMTRCPVGHLGTQEFHLFPFHQIYQKQLAVIPIVFIGTDRVWPKGRFCLFFREKIKVIALSFVRSQDYPNAIALRDAVQKKINAELEKYGT